MGMQANDQKTKKPIVLAAVMLAMFMSAIEATIVSTAMPNIAAELGNFSLYSWVFSSYLLMQTATVLIYGKLSDLYGRKSIFSIGVIIFLIGSTLCGFASSMEMLILFRFVQGIGAGAVMTIAYTIVGDMYTKEERSQIQGYLSSVWGISAVIGPALGAFLVKYVDWSFVFWVNIPVGLLSILGVWYFLHEDLEKTEQKIDFIGSFLMVVTVVSLMILLVEGGVRWEWGSTPINTLITITIVGIILFILQERKAAEPMMPLHIWKYRAIAVSNIGSLTTGMILFGVSSFLPTYVQGVMGYSPFIAGFALTAMSIGWPISSTIAGKSIIKIGYRATSGIGGAALIIGGIIFVLLSPEKGPIWAAGGSFFTGVGMGLLNTSFIVSVQSTVGRSLRGITTASNNFMRQLGSVIGTAMFGGILNNRLQHHLEESPFKDEISIDSANLLLNDEKGHQLSSDLLQTLKEGLTISLHSVYWGVLILAIISFFIVLFMPVTEED